MLVLVLSAFQRLPHPPPNAKHCPELVVRDIIIMLIYMQMGTRLLNIDHMFFCMLSGSKSSATSSASSSSSTPSSKAIATPHRRPTTSAAVCVHSFPFFTTLVLQLHFSRIFFILFYGVQYRGSRVRLPCWGYCKVS